MAATIKDIARHLRISTSTVSYALNGGPRQVTDDLRKRILAAAKEMDYRPNRVARSLVTRTSNAIGVVPPTVETNVFLSPFVRLAWNAIVNQAEELGQDLLLFAGKNLNTPDEPGTGLLDGRIDGVVFIAPRSDSRSARFLSDRSFPFTSISSGSAFPGVHFNAENDHGAREALQHLFDLGHRRIAHVTGTLESSDAQGRLAAYTEFMESRGLFSPDLVIEGNFTTPGGYAAAKKLLALRPVPTAVFTANDELAFGLCRALREAGLDVPQDVSVVGFDDTDLSGIFHPPLTTVRQPIEEMASAALRGVVRLARGDFDVRCERMPTRLVIRSSTAPPCRGVGK